MSNLSDESKAEEVCKYFRDVIHDAGNTEHCRGASIVLWAHTSNHLAKLHFY